MIKIFNEIVKDGLSPNGLYVLMAIEHNYPLDKINLNAEKRLLEINGYIINDTLTIKGRKILDKYNHRYQLQKGRTVKKITGLSESDKKNVIEYREMFPKGNLPSGYPARVNIKDLEKRFIWFMENYDYSWETILEATRMYIEKYKTEDYKYMKTSAYFIFKSENGETISQLANFCDMVTEGIEMVVTPNYTSHTVL
jgi:hypothetical protein